MVSAGMMGESHGHLVTKDQDTDLTEEGSA
jgi:hypothetical protein